MSKFNFIKFLLGILIVIIMPALILWNKSIFENFNLDSTQWTSIAIAFLCYVLHQYTMHLMMRFPGNRSSISILPSISLWYGVCLSLIIVFRFDYSVTYLTITLILNIFMSFLMFLFEKHFNSDAMVYIPVGKTSDLNLISGVQWIKVNRPKDLNVKKIKAIVADLHSPDLDNEWQKFLADQTLSGTPVYNVKQVVESMTGRIKINHMYENNLGSLLPSSWYMSLKRVIDTSIILLTLPITLPIMLVTAIAIKLDDGGSVLYTQQRIGYRGIPFKMYKFRSMSENSKLNKQQNTILNDTRITFVGKFIRKTRIDEFPQFFNVLLGEMSLIGPRAEFKNYADELEKSVPFFSYRHIVRPGISGWAQVMHGYATGTNETKIKIEYDFYYIKHFSLSLDIVIFFKTIKTMLTGFGAR